MALECNRTENRVSSPPPPPDKLTKCLLLEGLLGSFTGGWQRLEADCVKREVVNGKREGENVYQVAEAVRRPVHDVGATPR